MDEISVLLALSSPVFRMRLRLSLAQVPGLQIAGEAHDPAQAAQLVLTHRPHLLLADQRLLGDFFLPHLPAQQAPPRVVLVVFAEGPMPTLSHIVLAGTLPFSASPQHMASILRRLVQLQAPARPDPPVRQAPPPDVLQRYHFTGPLEAPHVDAAAPQPPAEPAPGSSRRRRTRTGREEQLARGVFALQQQQRDAVTGFVGPAALEQTFRLLLDAQQAAAFVVVEVQDAQGTVLPSPPLDPALLRRLSATLRANLRQEDLCCRAGMATFVLLLPGMRQENAEEPLQRLRTAVIESCGRRVVGLGGRLAMGVAYWEAGLHPAAVLAQCQLAVRRTPNTGDGTSSEK